MKNFYHQKVLVFFLKKYNKQEHMYLQNVFPGLLSKLRLFSLLLMSKHIAIVVLHSKNVLFCSGNFNIFSNPPVYLDPPSIKILKIF